MITSLSIHDFLDASANELMVDVRTPAEFEQGHIRHARNLPIFTNEERVLVGTCYKQQGREKAILLGFELIGGRWAQYIRQVAKWIEGKKVFVHCWRGGMRSAAMAWALNLYGFNVYLLEGGYKAYRSDCHSYFKERYPFIILSGKTGCAKTATLLEMKKLGEQVIDLEELAQHQGSSFGSMGRMVQPSQETFENLLSEELRTMDKNRRIWLENESVFIGNRGIPSVIFSQMRSTQIIDIELPLEARLDFLESEYGVLDQVFLKESVLRISKRLGPNETKLTLLAIEEHRMRDFIRQVLVYYDKTYQKGKENRSASSIYSLPLTLIDPVMNAKMVIAYSNELFADSVQPLLQFPIEQDEQIEQTKHTLHERH